jgi:hypothetical protein
VDGTGSGSCPMVGFGISGVEPSGSATAVSVAKVSVILSYYLSYEEVMKFESLCPEGESNPVPQCHRLSQQGTQY